MAAGLQEIRPIDPQRHRGDLIFVHGLDGNATTTWQPRGRPDCFWPAWLADDLPDLGIWMLSYDAPVSQWRRTASPLIDLATVSLSTLDAHGIGQRPVVFVAHSLGGLLVKQMLRHATSYGDAAWLALHDHVRGVVFLSTPHAGSHTANWFLHLGSVLRTSVSVKELEAHNAQLRDLNLWFRHHVQSAGIRLQVYVEQRPTHGIQVVDPTSADPGIAGIVPIPIDADHVSIAKPEHRSDLVYRGVRTFVEECCAGLTVPVRVIQIAPEGELPDSLPPLQPILVTHPNNLPDEPTPFIGREQEIEQIAGLLQDPHIRLVTLTGPGGTGKTRLALQVGNTLLHHFRDGAFFVNLAPLADSVLVSSAVAEALGVKEEPGRNLDETLTGYLGNKHLLLVLDNCEHLLDASSLVSSLLDGCRELHVLVTSRIPLHLSREHEHLVPPLSVPDPNSLIDPEHLTQYEAVALFIERARSAKDSFAVTNENAPAVAEICYRLDGLPLAIELAAARIKLFPPQALLQRLSSRLQLLTGGAKDRPARQQTLRNAITWSYSLLSPEEQVLHARLSVFAGGCTFEAAEAVCNPDGDLDLLEGMTSLVDKSLLRQAGDAEPRCTMLETIREYAAEKLTEQGEAEALHAAHAAYGLHLAEEAQVGLQGPKQAGWLARLDAELDNLRVGMQTFLDRGQIGEELHLAAGLLQFWDGRGYWSEGRRWLEEGSAHGPEVAAGVRAAARHALAALAHRQGDYEGATIAGEESLALYRQVADRGGSARALNVLGNVASERGQYQQATSCYEQAGQLSREVGDRWTSASALLNLGTVAAGEGDLITATERYEEALVLLRELGDARGIAVTLGNLGYLTYRAGKLSEAEARLEEARTLAAELGEKLVLSSALQNLGELRMKQGQAQQAEQLLRESMLLTRELGGGYFALGILGDMAVLALVRGDAAGAAWLAGAEENLRQRLGIPCPPEMRADREAACDQARAMLGEEDFTHAMERGGALSLEEAIAFALGETT